MTDLRAQRKIVHLPSTELTPEVVLARTLEKSQRIKSVAVLIEWMGDEQADGGVSCDWSQMRMREIVYLSTCFRQRIDGMMAEDLVYCFGDPDKDLA